MLGEEESCICPIDLRLPMFFRYLVLSLDCAPEPLMYIVL